MKKIPLFNIIAAAVFSAICLFAFILTKDKAIIVLLILIIGAIVFSKSFDVIYSTVSSYREF